MSVALSLQSFRIYKNIQRSHKALLPSFPQQKRVLYCYKTPLRILSSSYFFCLVFLIIFYIGPIITTSKPSMFLNSSARAPKGEGLRASAIPNIKFPSLSNTLITE